MPVLLSFDLRNYQANEHNRIQSFFERLGWQNLGGSAYRYPRLGANQPVEDWFNHVIPALMLLRAFAASYPDRIASYTLDVQSSAGFAPDTGYGTPPVRSDHIQFYDPTNQAFGDRQLRDWLDAVPYPY